MRKSSWVGFLPFYLLTVIIIIGIAVAGNKTVTTVQQNRPVARRNRIVIDAGHGGIDGGATSCTGVLESRINLQIALRLEALLQLLGMDTVMIRTTDTSVYTEGNSIAAQKVSDIKERIRIVQETENAILVSIHQNTFSDARYGGAQVFYTDNAQSKLLANSLQQTLIETLNPGSKRQCKKADGIYLMQHIDRVGILLECGFLSNPQEEAKLRSDDYQKKLCCVIASCLAGYTNTP